MQLHKCWRTLKYRTAIILFLCAVCVLVLHLILFPVVHATLPGQQIWRQGVSSFLFGTNDTIEWSSQNIETQPAIQHALRRAGFTLVRSFFPDNASDGTIEQRLQVIERSGANCLGVITNIFNVTFD